MTPYVSTAGFGKGTPFSRAANHDWLEGLQPLRLSALASRKVNKFSKQLQTGDTGMSFHRAAGFVSLADSPSCGTDAMCVCRNQHGAHRNPPVR